MVEPHQETSGATGPAVSVFLLIRTAHLPFRGPSTRTQRPVKQDITAFPGEFVQFIEDSGALHGHTESRVGRKLRALRRTAIAAAPTSPTSQFGICFASCPRLSSPETAPVAYTPSALALTFTPRGILGCRIRQGTDPKSLRLVPCIVRKSSSYWIRSFAGISPSWSSSSTGAEPPSRSLRHDS